MIPSPSEGAPSALRGVVLMLAAIFLFSCMDAMAKGLMARLPAAEVIWARYVSQAAIVVLILSPRLPGLLRTAHLKLQIIRSALLFGATMFYFLGFSGMPIGEAAAIFSVAPLCITLLAALVLGERVGPRRIGAVIVGFVGAMIIIRPGSDLFRLWSLLPLLGAVSYASYAVATRFLGRDESVWTTFLYTALFGAGVASLGAPWFWVTPTWEDASIMLALGAVGGAGQLCLIGAFTSAPAASLAPLSYASLALAATWGWTFFGEMPDLWTVAGAAVIVASGVYVWLRERRRAAPPAA